MSLRYLYTPDENVVTAPPEENDWWAAIHRCGAGIALATSVAANALSASVAAQNANQYQDEIPTAAAPVTVDQDDYSIPAAGISPVHVRSPFLGTYDEQPTAVIDVINDDSFISWLPPIKQDVSLVVTIWVDDSDGLPTQITEEDAWIPRAAYISRLVVRVPWEGTYDEIPTAPPPITADQDDYPIPVGAASQIYTRSPFLGVYDEQPTAAVPIVADQDDYPTPVGAVSRLYVRSPFFGAYDEMPTAAIPIAADQDDYPTPIGKASLIFTRSPFLGAYDEMPTAVVVNEFLSGNSRIRRIV